MSDSRLQTSQPAIGPLEHEALARALASGYFGMGPETRSFERELAAYIGGGRTIVCTSTGTSALHLALAALALARDDEVLVPSLTFVATPQAVVMAGARPVMCDVDESTGLLDLDDAAKRLTAHTRAVVAVHYAGSTGNLQALYRFAQEHRLRVVEDAAHAFGSRSGGARVGSIGDIACFSFDPIKNITAGQGGAIATSDATVIERARAMRNLGIRNQSGATSADDFDVDDIGWRYQMSDLMAAIGRVQLSRFERELKPARLALVAQYRDRLRHVEGVRFLAGGQEAVPHILPILLPAHRRDAIRSGLAAQGFETKVHYKPNHLLAAFADGRPRPACERLYARLLTLPLHAGVTFEHVDRVASLISHHLASGERDAD